MDQTEHYRNSQKQQDSVARKDPEVLEIQSNDTQKYKLLNEAPYRVEENYRNDVPISKNDIIINGISGS